MSHMSSLLDAALPHRSRRYRQPWFKTTFSLLAKRLDSCEQCAAMLRASFKRLVSAMCADARNSNPIATLYRSSVMFECIYVPVSCHDELDTLMDLMLELAAPLLPDSCLSSGSSTSGSLDGNMTSIQRAVSTLLTILKAIDCSTTPPRRQRIYSLLLNAAIYCDKQTHPSSSSFATAACDHIFSRLGAFCQQTRSTNGPLGNGDFDTLVKRLLATSSFRSLIDESSFLALYMFLANHHHHLHKTSYTTTEHAFLAKMLDYARFSRMCHSNGWLEAAAAAATTSTSAANFETPWSHVFAALTSARLRRRLDMLEDAHGAHERAVWRLVMGLITVVANDQHICTLASQLVDYVIISQRESPTKSVSHMRTDLLVDLINQCFLNSWKQDVTGADEAPSMTARRVFCSELAHLVLNPECVSSTSNECSHYGTASSLAKPSNSSGRRFLSNKYMAQALYGHQPIVVNFNQLAERRIRIVNCVLTHVLDVIVSLRDQQRLNSSRLLDKLESVISSLLCCSYFCWRCFLFNGFVSIV